MPIRCRAAVVLALVALPALAADPELARDFEGYPLPKGAVARLGSMRLQHEKPVAAAVFTHDGKHVISVGKDRVVRTWEAETGKAVGAWPLTTAGEPTTLALSRKGDLLLVATVGGGIDGYDLPAGARRFTLPAPPPNPKRPTTPITIWATAFAADDKTLLTQNSEVDVTLWDLATGRTLKTHATATPLRRLVVIAPDAKSFGHEVADRKELVFFDAADGTELKKLDIRTDPTRSAIASSLALGPDGKTLAVVKDQKFSLWDLEKGKLLRTAVGVQPYTALRFSPDGRLLVVRPAPSAGWEALLGGRTGLELRHVNHSTLKTGSVAAVSPDSKRAVLLSPTSNRVRFWDIEEERELLSAEALSVSATHLDWLADGRVVSRSGKTVKVYDTATGELVGEQKLDDANGGPGRVVVTDDGGGLIWATAGDRVHVWHPGQPVKTTAVFPGGDEPEPAPPTVGGVPPVRPRPTTTSAVVSPDGRYYAYFAGNDHLKVRDLTAGTEVELTRPRTAPGSGTYAQAWGFTPDSKHLIGTGDGLARMWDAETGKAPANFGSSFERPNQILGFSGDGRTILFGEPEHVSLYERFSGAMRVRISLRSIDGPPAKLGGFPARVELPTCFSPDGLLLARATADGQVRIVPLAANVNGATVEALTPGVGKITALGFTPDGKRLATAGDAGVVLFWEVQPKWTQGRPELAFQKQELEGAWLALSQRDGSYAFGQMRRFAADPKTALPFLREKLDRPAPDPKSVAAWVGEVASARRPAAVDDLIEVGPAAQPEILRALAEIEKDRNKMYERENLVRALDGPNPLTTKAELRRLRVVEVLEWIGTAEARELVERLAKGPAENVVTRQAKATLARMTPPK